MSCQFKHSKNSPGLGWDACLILTGDLLIIAAQIVTAAQMVYEEKYVTRHNVPPLQAVGWEGTIFVAVFLWKFKNYTHNVRNVRALHCFSGLFGFSVLGILLIPMYFIKIGKPFSTDPEGRFENVLQAFTQMKSNKWIIVATLGNLVSIGIHFVESGTLL